MRFGLYNFMIDGSSAAILDKIESFAKEFEIHYEKSLEANDQIIDIKLNDVNTVDFSFNGLIRPKAYAIILTSKVLQEKVLRIYVPWVYFNDVKERSVEIPLRFIDSITSFNI